MGEDLGYLVLLWEMPLAPLSHRLLLLLLGTQHGGDLSVWGKPCSVSGLGTVLKAHVVLLWPLKTALVERSSLLF